jgi:hypothetical protein
MDAHIEKKNGYQPRHKTHLFLRGFFIFGFILTILIFISIQPLRSGVRSLRASLARCPNTDGTTTNFEEDERFQTFNSTADQLWKETVTPNGGFFIGETITDSQIYGIAMFHQLRCLAMVRSGFQELYTRIEGRSGGEENMQHQFDEAHLLH